MIIFPRICALALSLLSAGTDLKKYKVPNDLLLCFLIAALFSRVILLDISEITDCLLGLVLPFILLWVFFRIRKMGAGDIKLFCVLGAFMGPANILWCMLCSFVCGGAAALTEISVFSRRTDPEYRKIHVALLTVPAVAMWAGGVYG